MKTTTNEHANSQHKNKYMKTLNNETAAGDHIMHTNF